jgi:hypothetical protein
VYFVLKLSAFWRNLLPSSSRYRNVMGKIMYVKWRRDNGENNVHDMEKGQQKSAARRGIQDSSPDKASTDRN